MQHQAKIKRSVLKVPHVLKRVKRKLNIINERLVE